MVTERESYRERDELKHIGRVAAIVDERENEVRV